MIKIRVSGDQSRAAAVDSAMDALLAGAVFSRTPYQAAPVTIGRCPAGEGAQGARVIEDSGSGSWAADVMVAALDPGGNEVIGPGGPTEPRVPQRMCISSQIRVGEATRPLLRAPSGSPAVLDGWTRILLPIQDNGSALEVVEVPHLSRFLLLQHDVGSTNLLGAYDGVPSDAQIQAILDGRGGAVTRVRAISRLPAEGTGSTEVFLEGEPQPAPPEPML